MKNSLLLLVSIAILPLSIFGQGGLTPTGTPGMTMKSLDQIEARTPISSLPFTISTGGSYYLTKSLSVSSGNAITITVDNVTLDLNGFTISSTANPASGNAITLSGGRKSVRITNGNITGSITFNGSSFTGAGFSQEIVGSSADPMATTVSFVNVSGCATTGIFLQIGTAATLVDACNVWNVGGYGIAAVTVTNSTASNCGLTAITGNTVANSRGDCVANDIGIYASVAINCYATSTNNIGLLATNATNCFGANFLGTNPTTSIGLSAQSATGCYGASNASLGLNAQSAINCYGISSGAGDGIFAGSATNCFGSSVSGIGLSATSANNSQGTNSGSAYGLYISAAGVGCNGFSSNGNGLRTDGGSLVACAGSSANNIGLYNNGGASSACSGNSFGNDYGMITNQAENCNGYSHGGIGLHALVASNCFGLSQGNAAGLDGFLANVCVATSAYAPPLNVTHSVNSYGD